MVEAPLAGSIPLAERSDLLKAYRARWESLRWTQVTRLQSNAGRVRRPHFVGTTLVYAGGLRAFVLKYHRLPSGGTSGSPWVNRQLELDDRWSVIAFSVHFGANLLAVLMEERLENLE